MLKKLTQKEDIFKNESVIIAGAGPGNPKLITLKVLYAIKLADVIIYDALVNKAILSNSNKFCKLIFAGKTQNNKACTQEQIISWIINYAKQKKKVLRLKGGDPNIFGRGAEEIDYLKEKKISFSVFSGITASQGALNIIGENFISKEESCHLITGHKAINSNTPKINFKSIAKNRGKIIIYMGLNQLNYISKNLIINGKSKNSEVVIISKISLKKEKKIRTNLLKCSETINNFGLKTPAIIIIK